jgi:hypothetical protein
MKVETNPKWLYKPVEVDNLKEIQREIIPIVLKKIPNFLNMQPEFFHIVMREEIEPFAPCYTEFIKKHAVISQWTMCAISVTKFNMDFPIHIDCTDWEKRCYGLNLPVINCEGTYTVWYDTEMQGNLSDDDALQAIVGMQKPGAAAIEIGRWDASKPAWVNNSIPHRPISTHELPRVVLSARFDPELHKLLY